jgi:HSP20 family molecular chaperone IbpA
MSEKTREKSSVEELLADIDTYIQDWFQAKLPFTFESGARWVPPTDVYETDVAFHVTMAVPGIDPKDLSVRFEREVLQVTGVRHEACGESRRYHKMEIPAGPFGRRLRVTSPVDAGAIEVEYDHGMLRITLPKVRGARVEVPID